MREWVLNNDGARIEFAVGGQTSSNQQPGTAPTWVPDSAAAQPPARHDTFFQVLEPLKLRFMRWLAHSAKLENIEAPTAATWWP
eukprot:8275600-Pyramimonas_sp.AAC.1